MTSHTGSTKMTLKGNVSPPTFAEAMAGAVVQLSVVFYVWFEHSSARECLPDPRNCLYDPWGRQVVITLGLTLVLWLYSLRTLPSTGTSDPSVVDRCWSIAPVAYCWHFFWSLPVFAAAAAPRLAIMTVLTTAWGVRLTWNFARKGGFSGGEDYRWVEIRTWFKPGLQWESFNLLFICGFQQLVVLAFSSPAALVAQNPSPLNALDAVATVLCALCIVGETVADNQMFDFQTEKYRRIGAGEPAGPYGRGFIESGLWAYSRHPNYFCEVSLWACFSLFAVAATGQFVSWAGLGTVFLAALFVLPRASLDVTESLSSRKYKTYPEYQARVSRFVPWFPASSKRQ